MRKLTLLVAAFIVLGLLAACGQATPEVVVEEKVVKETVVVVEEVEKEVVVTPTAEPEKPAELGPYRIGIFEEPISLNYWNYLGPGSSVWTQYVLSGQQPSLFGLSDQRFQWVPVLAKDLPADPDEEGDVWTVTVEMVENAQWSDGAPITAHDVAFTHNTCKDLQLTSNWPNQCAPMGADVAVEALDDYTVKYTFQEKPGLGVWQMGVGLAPIMPQHFWGDTVAKAREFIDGVEQPDVDCSAEDLSEDAQAACDAYSEAFENARKTLYEADASGSPSAGGFQTTQWEAGAFVQRNPNDNYYFKGSEVIQYEDETWVRQMPDGTTLQLFGDAQGAETLRYTAGPHSPNVILSIYGSQDSAFLALAQGEVDYVLNPLGLTRGLREQAERGEGIRSITNADYGMFYLAFNMRNEPMSRPEFREAFDILIDKEFVVNSVLQGTVFPMYSTMPPGNGYWHNPDVPRPFVGLSRAERIERVIEVLTEAGWSWDQQPEWSDERNDVIPGEGLRTPNGELMEEVTILGPGPAYDPIRATFNQWIGEWAREAGIPVRSELTGFNVILTPVFVEANFDMYILGWSLGNPAFPDYYESFWHSRNDTAVSGNFNTPGYNDADYDAMVDEFMSTTDLEQARELIFEMQVKLAEDRPYIPLFYQQVTDLIRDNMVLPYEEVLGGIVGTAGFQTDAQILVR